jgi:hypothetical protein
MTSIHEFQAQRFNDFQGTDLKNAKTLGLAPKKVMPGYRERKEWLRKNGAGLDI